MQHQQAAIQPPQQPLTYVHTAEGVLIRAPRVYRYDHYPAKRSLVLGVIQILCSVTAVICNVIVLNMSDKYVSSGTYGLMCGGMFLLAGCAAVGAYRDSTRNALIGTLIMSGTSSLFAGLLVFLISTLIRGAINSDCKYGSCSLELTLSMSVILVLVAGLDGVCAVWVFVICCTALRRGQSCVTTTHQTVYQSVSQTTVYHPPSGPGPQLGPPPKLDPGPQQGPAGATLHPGPGPQLGPYPEQPVAPPTVPNMASAPPAYHNIDSYNSKP